MFISTSEIDHLTFYWLGMIWLNWSLKLHTRLWTSYTWSTHTRHKTNVQWMLIPFVWLYVFKRDVYTQLLVNQTQKDFWAFYMFLKVFLCFCVFRVFVKIFYFLFLTKNSFRGIFASKSRFSSFRKSEDEKKKLENTEIQTKSFMTVSWEKTTREN